MKLIVLDNGNSRIIKFLVKMQALGPGLKIEKGDDPEGAVDLLKKGRASALLIFPPDFDQRLDRGEIPKIEFFSGDMGGQTGRILMAELNRVIYFAGYGKQLPEFLEYKSIYGKDMAPDVFMLPTWILFTMMGGFMVIATSLGEEREKKTLPAILATSCTFAEVMTAKVIHGTLLATAGGALILLLNNGVSGNWAEASVFLALGAFTFSLLGITVGILAPNLASTNSIGSIVFILLFTPVALGPVNETLSRIAQFMPSYYVYQGIIGSLSASVADGGANLSVLALFCLGLFFLNIFISGKITKNA